ncbi:MAG: translation initiation factor IF-2 [Candidatus Spyradenecus sp.]
MRVSEFAKQANLPAGIVLAKAKALGLEVSSTLSALEPDELTRLAQWAKGLMESERAKLLADYEAKRKSRKAKGETVRAEEARQNREAVEAHRSLALEAEAKKGERAAPAPKPVAPKAPEVKPEPKAEPAPKAEPKPEVKPAKVKAEAPVVPVKAPEAKVEPKVEPPKAEPKPAPAAAKPAAPKATLAPTPAPAPVPPPKAEPPKPKFTASLGPTPKATPVSLGLSPTQPAGGNRDKKRGERAEGPAGARGPGANRFANGPQAAPGARGNAGAARPGDRRSNDRYGRNDRADRAEMNERSDRLRKPVKAAAATIVTSGEGKKLQLDGPVTVKELAELMGVRPNLLIMDLMGLNVLASINQMLEMSVIQKVAEKYGFAAEVEERSKRSAERKPQLKSEDADDEIPEDKPEEMKLRPPVVTFLGHVDHGKTTLMDYIRKAHVAAGEAGGITQHIAAYTIELEQRDDNGNKRLITFVDTPGHSAFESMRARGANITDIAVIIVAADDGVMPQTREAIKHARNAGVQMLVAVTKCDKPDANPMRVYQMLQGEGLTPSTWGGDIECCEVSGTTGQGVEDLLETILIQADVMELQANPNRRANGAVIESQLEQGLGPTATLLVQGGTLHVGDVVLCGEHYGKVRSLIDERGKPTKSAGPSIAVKCTGLSGVPEAGSEFRVMLNEKRARELAEKTAEANKLQSLSAAQSSIMADWTKRLEADGKGELDVIVKGDAQGTAEAVVECLKGIVSQKVSLKILYSGVGSVTAADVQRAKGAIVVGFGVNCEPGVQAMARQNGVRINTFRIIYELIEHVKRCMLELIAPEYKEVVRGHAEIRQVFDISKLGKIAGCQMLDGSLTFKGKFRIYRGKTQIFDGAVVTMKHFKDDVKEIAPAQECGLGFGSFEEFREGDTVECYEMEELPKTL